MYRQSPNRHGIINQTEPWLIGVTAFAFMLTHAMARNSRRKPHIKVLCKTIQRVSLNRYEYGYDSDCRYQIFGSVLTLIHLRLVFLAAGTCL